VLNRRGFAVSLTRRLPRTMAPSPTAARSAKTKGCSLSAMTAPQSQNRMWMGLLYGAHPAPQQTGRERNQALHSRRLGAAAGLERRAVRRGAKREAARCCVIRGILTRRRMSGGWRMRESGYGCSVVPRSGAFKGECAQASRQGPRYLRRRRFLDASCVDSMIERRAFSRRPSLRTSEMPLPRFDHAGAARGR
jgi:hypothetical protein